jgi:hypothetical protein
MGIIQILLSAVPSGAGITADFLVIAGGGGVEATEILLEGVVVAQVDIALAQEPLAAVLLLNLN